MPYVKPEKVVEGLIQAGAYKARLGSRDVLIRGFLSGALLGYATSLAVTATAQTELGIVGALVFPVGFVMIVLLGLELVTGNFALLPLALLQRRATLSQLVHSWVFAFLGNLAGGIFYAVLFYGVTTKLGHTPDSAVIKKIVAAAEGKTLGYAHWGSPGLVAAFLSAILCNWMVTLGVVMSFTSASTIGKIVAMWLPILIFFAQGYEHSVVNMFLIPAGILLGANVSFWDWWIWNQIPVTVGNIIGGVVFTGFALYLTYGKKTEEAIPALESERVDGPEQVPAESSSVS